MVVQGVVTSSTLQEEVSFVEGTDRMLFNFYLEVAPIQPETNTNYFHHSISTEFTVTLSLANRALSRDSVRALFNDCGITTAVGIS